MKACSVKNSTNLGDQNYPNLSVFWFNVGYFPVSQY